MTDKERIASLEQWKTDIIPMLKEMQKDIKFSKYVIIVYAASKGLFALPGIVSAFT